MRKHIRWLVVLLMAVTGPVFTAAPVHAAATASLYGNAGAAGVSVEVYLTGAATPTVIALSQSDGAFQIGELDPGSYQVHFVKQYFVPIWYGGNESRTSAAPVTLTDSTATEVSASLDAAGVISGVVRIAGATKSAVRVYGLTLLDGAWVPESDLVVNTITEGRYTYRLSTALPVTLYILTGATPGRSYRVYSGDAFNVSTAASVQPGPGGTTANADINAPASATLTGTLTNSFGGPITGTVNANVRDHGQVVPLEGAGSGYVGLTGFNLSAPAGSEVTLAGRSPYFTDAWLGGAASAADATFRTLTAGETRGNNTVALPGGLGLSGTLSQGYSQGVEGVEVTAWYNGILFSQTVTNYWGSWRLPGFQWAGAGVKIRFQGDGLVTTWKSTFGLTTDEASASTFYGDYDRDRTNIDATAIFRDDAKLAAVSAPSVLNDVEGKPLAVQLPTFSQTPDKVEVQVFEAGVLSYTWDLGDQVSGAVEVAPPGGMLRFIGMKHGFQNAASDVTLNPHPFAASARPTIKGVPRPGKALRARGARFNATPATRATAWFKGRKQVGSGATYRPKNSDVGHKITVRVTATYGDATATTTRSVKIQPR